MIFLCNALTGFHGLLVVFRLNTARFLCGMLIAAKCFGALFRGILLPHKELLLLRGQITPSQLIPANPRNGFFAVLESERHGGERDFGMLLNDFITIMAINKCVVPHDQRRNQLACNVASTATLSNLSPRCFARINFVLSEGR